MDNGDGKEKIVRLLAGWLDGWMDGWMDGCSANKRGRGGSGGRSAPAMQTKDRARIKPQC